MIAIIKDKIKKKHKLLEVLNKTKRKKSEQEYNMLIDALNDLRIIEYTLRKIHHHNETITDVDKIEMDKYSDNIKQFLKELKDKMNKKRLSTIEYYADYEEVPTEELWEDGEISKIGLRDKLYHRIIEEGDWIVMREKETIS